MTPVNWEKVQRVVGKYAHNMTANTSYDDREDFAQIGIIRAWELMVRGESEGYIIRAGTNAIRDASRVHKTRNCFSPVIAPYKKIEDTPDFLALYADKNECLQYEMPEAPLVFDTLPLRRVDREVIFAEWAHELQADAAVALGITTCAFKGRLHRAQKRARQLAGICQ